MGIIYVDRLSPFSLMTAIRASGDYSDIYYFNHSRFAMRLADLLLKLRLLKATPEPLAFNLSQITDENDACRSYQISEDVTTICGSVSTDELLDSDMIKSASKNFDQRKLSLFFKKIIAWDIEMPVIYINAAEWHSRQKGADRALLVFRNRLWFSYLADYAEQLGLTLTGYGRRLRSDYFKRHFSRAKAALKQSFQQVKKAPLGLVANPFTWAPKIDLAAGVAATDEKPKLAALLAGRTVTFDLKKRSDFFWLLKSKIPFEQVLIYLATSQLKPDRAMVDLIADKKISLVALSKKSAPTAQVSVWPASVSLREYLKYALPVFWRFLRHPRKNYFYALGIFYFVAKYLQWSKFFEVHNIKVNLNPTDFMEAQIPMQQALEDSGGVSVSYHWSNIDFTSTFMSNCADVLFSFGPAYKRVFDRNGSVVDNLVYCGYITDYCFKEVREDALKLRERLMDRGAKFILCFFDENSSDNIKSIITHEKATKTYKYFLEKALEDETLGLICKPGYPRTIYQRISPISDLIARAKDTGRCVFLDEGTHVSERYPAEAAQAADLSVGLLLSGTVGLESYLSGTPTVLLDLENLYFNPIYKWGRGKVIFNTMDELFSAIGKYRQEPSSMPGFGDLSRWAEGKDPFRDGKASLRIGQYLNWLLEKFNEDRTRNEAIAYANANYQREWGIGPDSVNSSRMGS